MKRKYDKPAMRVVQLHHRSTLLAGSVIGPGADNEPPGAPELFDDPAWDALLGE